jgi:hypothetical protein
LGVYWYVCVALFTQCPPNPPATNSGFHPSRTALSSCIQIVFPLGLTRITVHAVRSL